MARKFYDKRSKKNQKNKQRKAKDTRSQLEKTFHLINKQMEWCKQIKFSLKKKNQTRKKGNIHAGVDDYETKIKTLIRKYELRYGTSNLSQIKPENMEALLIDTYKNAWTIKAYTAALKYFQESTKLKDRGLDGSPVRPVNLARVDGKDGLREYYKKEKIIRHTEETHTGHLSHEQYTQINRYLINLNEELSGNHHEATRKALEFATKVGARHDEIIGVTKKDIILHKDGTVTVHLFGKGRKHRFTHITDESKVNYLKKLKNSLKKDDRKAIEPLRYQKGKNKGKEMKKDAVLKRMKTIMDDTTKILGLKDGEKSLSFHSGRKYYTQNEAVELARLSVKELKDIVKDESRKQRERVASEGVVEGVQFFNGKKKPYTEPDIMSKYQDAVDRVNWISKEKGIRRTKKNRDLNHKELVLFVVSLRTGHYRTDIIEQYYVNWDKVKKAVGLK